MGRRLSREGGSLRPAPPAVDNEKTGGPEAAGLLTFEARGSRRDCRFAAPAGHFVFTTLTRDEAPAFKWLPRKTATTRLAPDVPLNEQVALPAASTATLRISR